MGETKNDVCCEIVVESSVMEAGNQIHIKFPAKFKSLLGCPNSAENGEPFLEIIFELPIKMENI